MINVIRFEYNLRINNNITISTTTYLYVTFISYSDNLQFYHILFIIRLKLHMALLSVGCLESKKYNGYYSAIYVHS